MPRDIFSGRLIRLGNQSRSVFGVTEWTSLVSFWMLGFTLKCFTNVFPIVHIIKDSWLSSTGKNSFKQNSLHGIYIELGQFYGRHSMSFGKGLISLRIEVAQDRRLFAWRPKCQGFYSRIFRKRFFLRQVPGMETSFSKSLVPRSLHKDMAQSLNVRVVFQV